MPDVVENVLCSVSVDESELEASGCSTEGYRTFSKTSQTSSCCSCYSHDVTSTRRQQRLTSSPRVRCSSLSSVTSYPPPPPPDVLCDHDAPRPPPATVTSPRCSRRLSVCACIDDDGRRSVVTVDYEYFLSSGRSVCCVFHHNQASVTSDSAAASASVLRFMSLCV